MHSTLFVLTGAVNTKCRNICKSCKCTENNINSCYISRNVLNSEAESFLMFHRKKFSRNMQTRVYYKMNT